MAHERRRSRAGFTIIEVLVALEQRVALIQTARAVETGLPRRGQLAPGQLAGEIAGHRWRINVSPLAAGGVVEDSPWLPQAIVIRVQSPSGAVLELNTVRLSRRPKQ